LVLSDAKLFLIGALAYDLSVLVYGNFELANANEKVGAVTK
jgi:hypothetical protein